MTPGWLKIQWNRIMLPSFFHVIIFAFNKHIHSKPNHLHISRRYTRIRFASAVSNQWMTNNLSRIRIIILCFKHIKWPGTCKMTEQYRKGADKNRCAHSFLCPLLFACILALIIGVMHDCPTLGSPLKRKLAQKSMLINLKQPNRINVHNPAALGILTLSLNS